jgi:hypothetical protein
VGFVGCAAGEAEASEVFTGAGTAGIDRGVVVGAGCAATGREGSGAAATGAGAGLGGGLLLSPPRGDWFAGYRGEPV